MRSSKGGQRGLYFQNKRAEQKAKLTPGQEIPAENGKEMKLKEGERQQEGGSCDKPDVLHLFHLLLLLIPLPLLQQLLEPSGRGDGSKEAREGRRKRRREERSKVAAHQNTPTFTAPLQESPIITYHSNMLLHLLPQAAVDLIQYSSKRSPRSYHSTFSSSFFLAFSVFPGPSWRVR